MKINKFIGAHVSVTGGVSNGPKNAADLEAKAFGMFLKNQRRWDSKPYTVEEIELFKKNMKEHGYTPEHVLPHDGYLINLGNRDDEKRQKSLDAFIDEIERTDALGLIYLNAHPGSHLNEISEEESLGLIADCLNVAIAKTKNVRIV
ncbi:MAG: deoxyribonuclease IV, partial [Fusobacteriaceae bacterium]